MSGVCYRCGQPGHFAAACGKQQQQQMPIAAIAENSAPCAIPVAVHSGAAPSPPSRPLPDNVTDVYGDLMTSTDSLCHCVSECLSMGKGIAVLFKNQFGCVDALKAQQIGVGGVAVLDRTSEEGRYIYYLITKPKYFHKPTYATLAASLAQMFQHMAAHGVTRVSMPEIGCGLDMLEWPKVREMLNTMLEGSGIRASVYHYKPPADSPAAVRPRGRGRGGN
jgi:O-acetyl-ADP-ribose deacetylase (regulator of RNase III)